MTPRESESKVNILLVDDDAGNLLALEAILAPLGQNLVRTRSGEEALSLLSEHDFAVVLIDVLMDGLDGFETAKRIRARERSRQTPIIFLTAFGDDPKYSAGAAYALGAVDYLVKPLVPIIVRAKVSGFLDLFRKNEQLARAEAGAREQLRNVLATVNDMFLIFDRELRYTYVNDRMVEASGIPREKLLGRRLQEVFPDVTGSLLEKELLRTLEQQVPTHFEFYHASFNRWFDNRAYPTAEGLSVVATEITDTKKAEHALRYLAAIVESSSDMILSTDLGGIIKTWNKGAEKLLGFSAEEAIGKHISTLFPSEHSEDWENTFDRLQRGERVENYETRRRRKDGTVVDVSFTLSPIRDTKGQIIGVSRVGRDITRLKTLEAERQESERRKDEFLAMLAHELRNPLSAIRNAVRLARESAAPDDLTWSRTVVERQLHNLSRLIDDLLDVARITRGKIQLRTEPLDLSPIMVGAAETVKPLVEEREQQFSVFYPTEPLWVRGDPTRIDQILINLLTNAAKYTPSGGQIWLTAERTGDEALIKVRDNGVGIPPEILPKMFELFAQGERSLARSEGGLGIGLTLVKKLTELHGGKVTAQSEGVGKGSEFTVTLPVAAAPRLVGAETEHVPRKSVCYRILIVDDNVDTAHSLARLLRLHTHEVHVAASGPEAIQLAQKFPPDFVLMDLGLPDIDGIEVTRELREEPCCKDSVFVAITGYGEEATRKRAREAGFEHYLVKPIDFDVLLALLARRRT